MPSIYLDNSMTTRPSDRAISEMMPYFTEMWGTPSAPHHHGQHLYPAIKEGYQSLYQLFGATTNDTIILTSSGAESVNHAIFSGYYDRTLQEGKNHFITSNTDEAPTMMAINRLEEMGCASSFIQVNAKGQLTPDAFADQISPRTAMISLSWANGLTGVIQPVEEIAMLCKERGILLHLDATHVLGKIFIDLDEIQPDFISFNGDHLHGPKGTGGLYIKNGVHCTPWIVGGMEQAGLRAGTLNVPGLIGLSAAAREALESIDYFCMEVTRLRDRLECGILENLPEAVIFFQEEHRLPHCTTIGFPGIANEALLYLLNRRGVYACIGGGSFQQIGLILNASGVTEPLAHSAISFALSRETTEEEIETAIKIIVESAKQLMKMSNEYKREFHGH